MCVRIPMISEWGQMAGGEQSLGSDVTSMTAKKNDPQTAFVLIGNVTRHGMGRCLIKRIEKAQGWVTPEQIKAVGTILNRLTTRRADHHG